MTPLNQGNEPARRETFIPTARGPVGSIVDKLSQEDRVRLRQILSEPIEYLDHESFSRNSTAHELFSAVSRSSHRPQPWCNLAELGPIDGQPAVKCVTLNTAQELRLFLRMNYARFRMSRILKEYADNRLTAKAAGELLWWHSQAIAARCEIVQANVPLVLAMAKRTRMGNIDYAELISEGNMALLRSVDKFDCSRGFKFSTYACRAILKSFSRVAMKTSRYRGRFPTEFDPSLEKSDFLDLQRVGVEADCVDELRGILLQNTAELNDVEYKVIQARFALGQVTDEVGGGPKTLEQVGLLIGVTKERVRQIQNRALAKLRSKLQDDFLAA
ncbi:MAG TPA: sigma-70 family RNA polymerase sigma factor [Phycisphaerae bacterium]|nr:sigma-70 family RNA polymerase sigma factor [Phycisphaerae bacterium]